MSERGAHAWSDYVAGALSPEDEARFEERLFDDPQPLDLQEIESLSLLAGIRLAPRHGHVLSVVSRDLVRRIRSERVPIQEASVIDREVRLTLDRSKRVILARLPVELAGATRVDVRFHNEWDGSVQEELGVRLDEDDGLTIACGTRWFAEARGVLVSRCSITDAGGSELASYRLILDAGP